MSKLSDLLNPLPGPRPALPADGRPELSQPSPVDHATEPTDPLESPQGRAGQDAIGLQNRSTAERDASASPHSSLLLDDRPHSAHHDNLDAVRSPKDPVVMPSPPVEQARPSHASNLDQPRLPSSQGSAPLLTDASSMPPALPPIDPGSGLSTLREDADQRKTVTSANERDEATIHSNMIATQGMEDAREPDGSSLSADHRSGRVQHQATTEATSPVTPIDARSPLANDEKDSELPQEGSRNTPSRDASTPACDTPTRATARAPKTVQRTKRAAAQRATGSAKPPSKKLKVATDGTPSARGSTTPTASRASRTPAAPGRKRSTPSALSHSPAPPPEDDDADGSTEVFCICRRPDNHTWMIACDGGCDDWFHGSCVNIAEADGDLIDKYICPNCTQEGKHTTWKRMCRLDDCRRPARVTAAVPSKYCSDEHGREFMRQRAQLPRKRKRGQSVVEEDEPAIAVGGVLSRGQLAAVVTHAKSMENFRKLGESVLSPPATATSEADGDVEIGDGETGASSRFTREEQVRTEDIIRQRAQLAERMQGLADRERFVQLVKEQAKRLQDESSHLRDSCGFDRRLCWTEERFLAWRASEIGAKALADGILPAPADEDAEAVEGGESGTVICQKKRCERHKQWRNGQMAEVWFEQVLAKEESQKLLRQLNEIQKRATLRHLREKEGDPHVAVEFLSG